MNKGQFKGLLIGAIVAALAAGAGYWAGSGEGRGQGVAGKRAEVAATDSALAGKKERPILYYRNPMGLADTSPTPKKDSMGMDYVPVYAGDVGDDSEAQAPGQIRISSEKIQKLGVRTELASLRPLDTVLRAAGRIEADERRIHTIAPKFEGYVERLHVNATGQAVAKGQPLFEVYSPELVSAQREYLIASDGLDSLGASSGEAAATTLRGMRQLAEASLARLRNWDVSDGQIKALRKSGEARRTLSFLAPVGGIVTEKKAVQGMRFIPGEALYQVTELSTVWLIAELAEQDIGAIRTGTSAKITIDAYPDKTFAGTVTYVYPTLKVETRSVAVRVELANPGGLLKPGMYAQVELAGAAKGPVLSVPSSAVIDSGKRQIVLVALGEGRFAPREVKLGARSDERVEVLAGVRDGEAVVVAANFLIDAESRLNAALAAFGSTPENSKAAPASVGHQAVGRVEEIDSQAGTASISHEAIASLKWPAMTMEFKSANDAILGQLKPGSRVAFEFVERGQGEWVITAVAPANAGNPAKPAGAGAHAGH